MKQQLATLLVIATAFFTTASHAEGVAVTETGDSIPYMTYGAGETTLVLVHGWTNNRTFWEPHIPGLSDRYQVVTLDLASFGESLVKRNDWSMRSFAMDIDAVLGQVKAPKVVLVGFSMGGAPVIELAALGRVDAIEARMHGRWAGNAHMHFLGAGLAHHFDNLARGGAANDAVIDENNAFTFKLLAVGVVL